MVADTGSTRAVRSAGRLNAPRPALVEANASGVPRLVNRQSVALVREEWRVVDRWWTEEPVVRRYFELVLDSGQNSVVFRDEERAAGSPSARDQITRLTWSVVPSIARISNM